MFRRFSRFLRSLWRFLRGLPYRGAGVLFAHAGTDGLEILLFQRSISPYRGYWSVVGGRCNQGESFQQTAVRETSEEALGGVELEIALKKHLPLGFEIERAQKHAINVPFLFYWRTYWIELPTKPDLDVWRLNWENDAMEWYPVTDLPTKTHRGVRWSLSRFARR